MAGKGSRGVPRPFQLHWGGGQIQEEATYTGEHHQPAIQLLQFDEGYRALRFCYYDHAGRFQRGPLIVSDSEIPGLRKALEATPGLRAMLKELLA